MKHNGSFIHLDCCSLLEKPCHPIEGNDPALSRTASDNREFVEAVLWLARTGAPWRDLPPNSARGRARTCAFLAGAEVACGSGSPRPRQAMPICSGCSSIQPSCEPTNMGLAP
ncbi:transposase [Mycetohabitans rhizoxinica]